jgi:hypothetical protein
MFKSIQDQIKSINDTFRTILQKQITQNLQLMEQQEEQQDKEEDRSKKFDLQSQKQEGSDT